MKINEVSILEHLAFLAGKYRGHAAKAVLDNQHLHEYQGPALNQQAVDATLTMFLNFVAMSWGAEALFVAKDLEQFGALSREEAPKIQLMVAEDEVEEETEESRIVTADSVPSDPLAAAAAVGKKSKPKEDKKIIIP